MDETGTERSGGLPAMGPGIRGRGARRAQFAAAQRRGLLGTAAVLGLKLDRYRVKSTARATRCMCITRYFAPHSRAVDRPRSGICVRLSSSRIPRPCSCAVFPYVSFRLRTPSQLRTLADRTNDHGAEQSDPTVLSKHKSNQTPGESESSAGSSRRPFSVKTSITEGRSS